MRFEVTRGGVWGKAGLDKDSQNVQTSKINTREIICNMVNIIDAFIYER